MCTLSLIILVEILSFQIFRKGFGDENGLLRKAELLVLRHVTSVLFSCHPRDA